MTARGVAAGLLAALLLAGGAAAAPLFSDDGPDADAYGRAAGYPIGKPASGRAMGTLVGRFSHFDRLYPARSIAPAATPSPLRHAATEPAVTYTHDGRQRDIAGYLAANPATGLLILRGDTILVERYQYGRTDRHRLTSMSMAKTIVGLLAGIAIAEGHIKSVDDPAETYVPALAGSAYGATTIRDLLHMASGVHFTEDYSGTDDATKLMLGLFGRPGKPAADILRQFNDRDAPPGTRFHYAGADTETLGLVVAAATGETLSAYLQSRIWARIGTEGEATWAIDGQGQEVAPCCFNATLRDYARLGRLLAQDGQWDGRQVIPKQWLLDATTITRPEDDFLKPGTLNRATGYGYQLWLLNSPRRMFALLGIHGQAMFIEPTSGLVMVTTSVRPLPQDPGSREAFALWQAVVMQLGKG